MRSLLINDINLEDIIVSSTETINKKLELLRDIILSDIPSEELISENFEEIKEKVDDVKNILNKIDEQTSNSLTLQNALISSNDLITPIFSSVSDDKTAVTASK